MSEFYDLLQHARMVGDRRRVDAYVAAIHQTVRPGAVVVDIGTGTGIFAMAACQAGARVVYAIEPSPVVNVAREIITANGFAGRVVFIERLSTEVVLPEFADVVVLDVRGVLPDAQIAVAVDAQRFLRASGKVLPARDEIWAAIVSAPDLYRRDVGCWDQDTSVDMRPLKTRASATWRKCRVRPSQLAVPPQRLMVLDYRTQTDIRVEGRAGWTVDAPATAHGLVVWFESDLTDDVRLSNRPGAPELLYGQGYFPWERPVPLHVGQTVSISLTGEPVGSSYRWRCAVGGTNVETGDTTRQISASGPIVLTEAGQIDRLILDRMASGVTLGAIAEEVRQLHPTAFPRVVDALTRVATLSLRYA